MEKLLQYKTHISAITISLFKRGVCELVFEDGKIF